MRGWPHVAAAASDGRVEPRAALWFGIALGAVFALFALAVNMTAALLAMAGLLGYVFVYTLWLKPITSQNIVIGGAAGAVPPLVGWAAAAGRPRRVRLLPVRDRLLLDAAALLGARAPDQGRLRAHGHPDAAGGRRRARDPPPDPALRLAAAGDHRAAPDRRALRRGLRISGAVLDGVFLWLCVRLYRRATVARPRCCSTTRCSTWRCSSRRWPSTTFSILSTQPPRSSRIPPFWTASSHAGTSSPASSPAAARS